MKLFNIFIKNRGFTLLELLVVIAIIGVLASIVMTNINSAREKSNRSAYISELEEMGKLMELEHSTYGSYSGLFSNMWIADDPSLFASGLAVTCKDIYLESITSQYRANALSICNKISKITNNTGLFGVFLWTGNPENAYSISGSFKGSVYCVGSGGKSLPSTNGFNGKGCASNP